jgi:hypothetical protein
MGASVCAYEGPGGAPSDRYELSWARGAQRALLPHTALHEALSLDAHEFYFVTNKLFS